MVSHNYLQDALKVQPNETKKKKINTLELFGKATLTNG